ncbi:tRNA (adenosine(37)-N6)-threonylcarbamoyltransferase complex dimerization subunit type 1 TsaB [Thermovibrio ammonificans]|jgi:tRNA threonylcarbamoyladenosine biosynthesis protein TsaB
MVKVAVDLTLPEGSVALEVNGEVVGCRCWNRPRLHAEIVYAELLSLLKTFNLSPQEIDECTVTTGPGSFTGVRLSVTVGKAFKACGVKVRGVSTLSALLTGAPEGAVAVIPAMRGKVYARVGNKELDISPQELAAQLEKSQRPLIYKGELPPPLQTFPCVKDLTPLAVKALLTAESLPLTPNYVRDHDAKPQAGGL